MCRDQILGKRSRGEKAEEETKDLESYCGNGPKEKKGTKPSNVKASKSAFTGMCTIDSIVNLFQSINYIQIIRDHNICDHKDVHSQISNLQSRAWKRREQICIDSCNKA